MLTDTFPNLMVKHLCGLIACEGTCLLFCIIDLTERALPAFSANQIIAWFALAVALFGNFILEAEQLAFLGGEVVQILEGALTAFSVDLVVPILTNALTFRIYFICRALATDSVDLVRPG